MSSTRPLVDKSYNEAHPHFILQWHLTAKCDNHCSYCYMYDSDSYIQELKNELEIKECIKIIDDFSNMLKRWGISGIINFTGGDPLLKPEIFDLINYAVKNMLYVGILGNPNKLNLKTAKKLKKAGIARYQVSIDGLEKTNDSFRGKENFQDSIRAIRLLNKVGISSVVMFTLSEQNANELIDVINLVANEGVSVFDFARIVPIGSGKNLKESILTPQRYHALLLRILEEYKKILEKNQHIHFGRKDPLWKLLYSELGLLKHPSVPENKDLIYGGCAIGINHLSILADGTVYPCRRLPVKIGKVPEQSIRDIFIESDILNKMRESISIEKCGQCELKQFCRGCRAIGYAFTGNYMSKDPQCWKGDDVY